MSNHQDTKGCEAQPIMSFVIPHRGRIQYLIDTVQSIVDQDYCQENVEIIVITQEPDLNVGTMNSKVTGNTLVKMTVLNEDKSHTISTLRNIGAERATGKYIAFVDADIALADDWITSMTELLESDPQRIIVSAIQIPSTRANWLEKVRSALSNIKTDVNLLFLPGRNLLMTKQNFLTIGGFPDALRTCEDYYFTNQATARGKLFYSSRSSYIHLGEDKALKGLFEKEIWRGYSNIDSLYGRTVSLSELPSFIVPIGVLVSFVALTTFALSGMWESAVIMALMMQTVVLIYSCRLKLSAPDDVHLLAVMLFYNIYFIGRGIGMVKERRDFIVSGFFRTSR